MRSLSAILLASASILLTAGMSPPVAAAPEAPNQTTGIGSPADKPAQTTGIGSPADQPAQTGSPAQIVPGLPQKLQELVTTKISDVIERKEDRAAVQAFYTQRNF